MTNIDEVKKIIENGFDDLELIAFELDIPIEQVKQCKAEIEASKQKATLQKSFGVNNVARNEAKKVNTINTGFNEENYKAHVKMDRIRYRFGELVYGKKKQDQEGNISNKKEGLSAKENEKINLAIVTIDTIIQKMEVASKPEKREFGKGILEQLRKIDGYELSLEQAERLYDLMKSSSLLRLKLDKDDKIDVAISEAKRKLTTKFVKAINLKVAECDDIQELQDLLKMITEKMSRESQIFVGGLKSSISNKIMKLQQQQRIDKMRNDVPMNIGLVIQALVSGKINIQSAIEIIDEEAKKRVDNSPKSRFALSEEAQRRQILMQIKTVLVEKGATYAIQVPEIVIGQLQELCGIGQEEAIRIVVRNCIVRKDYKMARDICDKNDIKNEYGFTVKSIASLRDEIIHAEFADIVLEGMNNARTHQDEKAYIDMIQKAIASGQIRLTGVKLGKSVDGMRDVTLADIWDDGRGKQVKSR